jgi:hypothetical protein
MVVHSPSACPASAAKLARELVQVA